MNTAYTDELPIAELAAAPERVFGKDAMKATLHFCSPAHGGWGVIRVACLLPETQLLFVCPEACGRHGAIAAIEQGYRQRITYLCVDEHELISGGYEDEIKRAVDDIMIRVRPAPKAIILFLPCVDDLLASDHSASIREMENKHGVPIRIGRMNPIMLDGAMPPMLRLQRTMYEFLPPPPYAKKDRGIILLGSFRPPSGESELALLVRCAGFGPLRHPEFCSSFEEFTAFSQSAGALVLRHEGSAAGDFLVSERDIPALRVPVAFDTPSIIARYQQIIDFLVSLDGAGGGISARELFADKARETAAKLESAAEALKGAAVAVDSTVTASPFSLALALVKGGVKVNRVYANYLPTCETAALKELAGIDGSIIAANPNHHKKFGARPERPLSDIALGFEAAYAVSAPVTVPLAFDEGRYGFEGFQMIIDALVDAAGEKENMARNGGLREQIRSYGLVV
jgi:hypothetical protein